MREDTCRVYDMTGRFYLHDDAMRPVVQAWTVSHLWRVWDDRYERCYHCGEVRVKQPQRNGRKAGA